MIKSRVLDWCRLITRIGNYFRKQKRAAYDSFLLFYYVYISSFVIHALMSQSIMKATKAHVHASTVSMAQVL